MADSRRSNVAGTARISLKIKDYKEIIETRVVNFADFDIIFNFF
jgi:hypothetical protein